MEDLQKAQIQDPKIKVLKDIRPGGASKSQSSI
jgi:hypothetical protein